MLKDMRGTELMDEQPVNHTFGPFYDDNSEILILGSFPSVKSRAVSFYYGHPQNRFWKVISAVFGETEPVTEAEKKAMLRKCHIALYDVIDSCTITGSSDSSIRNVRPTDLTEILKTGRIGDHIFVNGTKAYELYMKYIFPDNGIEPVKLPSTSPANAAASLQKLEEKWQVIDLRKK